MRLSFHHQFKLINYYNSSFQKKTKTKTKTKKNRCVSLKATTPDQKRHISFLRYKNPTSEIDCFQRYWNSATVTATTYAEVCIKPAWLQLLIWRCYKYRSLSRWYWYDDSTQLWFWPFTLGSKALTWNIYTFSSGCNVLTFYVLYMYIHANSEWLTIMYKQWFLR